MRTKLKSSKVDKTTHQTKKINQKHKVLKKRKAKSLSEFIFLKMLQKMQQGRLDIYYESTGEIFTINHSDDFSADITISDTQFFTDCVIYGEIGLGESYIRGHWRSSHLEKLLEWFLKNISVTPTFSNKKSTNYFVNKFFNLLGFLNRIRHSLKPNSKKMCRKNIAEHYDLSNEFFKEMLDPTMTYSSAIYLNDTNSLQEAQIYKYRLICEKLNLRKGDRLLEIGTGWGGFSIFAAQEYGCRITTITISAEQYRFAREKIKSEGLDRLVNVLLKDYRDIAGEYDKIVSIEMVEALGYKYFDVFFKKMASLLKKDGVMVIQCITFPDPYYQKYLKNTDFIQKHIFPGSLLLSLYEVFKSLNRTSELIVQDVESIGLHYAKTLLDWEINIFNNRAKIIKMGLSKPFLRKWVYYLTFCRVGFQNHYLNGVQIIFSKPMNPNITNYSGLRKNHSKYVRQPHLIHDL